MTPGSTPKPDESRTRSDDPDAPPGPRSTRPRQGGSDSTTSDEISVLLSSSLESPEPDPMLGGSSSWDLAKVASRDARGPGPRSSHADGLDVGVDLAATRDPARQGEQARGAEHPYDWAGLLVRSYASAVTLALGWLLWSGKAGPPPATEPARAAASARRRPIEPAPATAATASPGAPSVRTTGLGKPVVVDGLEVTPLLVLRRGVQVLRDLGDAVLANEHDGCLALTVRVKNLSSDAPLSPILAADLTDGEAFAIDAGPASRISMFVLAPGGEWVIEEQSFPEITRGEVADIVLLSEPVGDRRLPSVMTWKFRVATDPERLRRESLGVVFGPNDLP